MAEADFNVRAIISAQTSQFESGMKKAQSSLNGVSQSIQGIQNLLKSAFSVVGITASVGAIVNFGKKAVQSADEANKRFNILSNTIRATGASTWTSVEELDKMAKAYAQSTNYSVSEVEKMQSVLLGFRNITGDTFEQASDTIMDMATVMGMDLTSAVQTVGKALDDPVKGLDSLRRQGFQFTEEQKAELQQLVKNGKQLEAQQIILNELATTYGGASKAGQSAFAKLQHTMDELRESLGNKLMPVVNSVMENMTANMNKVTEVINSADFERFIIIMVNVGNKVKNVLDKILQEVKTTFDNIKTTFGSVDFGPFMKIMDTLVALVQKTFSEIKNRIQDSFATFAELKERMGVFTDALDLDKIVNIINTIVDVFSYLYDSIREIQEEIRKVIFDNIVNIWNYIKQIFQNSNNVLAENEKGFSSWAEFIWEQVNNVFRTFQDLFGMISQLIKGNWSAAWEYAKLAFMRMADTVLNLFSQIANAFPKLINKIIDGLNSLIEKINVIRGWLGQEQWDLINPFESVDLSESSGLNAKIADAEKKIAELTGKQADYAIDEIKKVSKSASGFTQNLIDEITDTTDVAISSASKRGEFESSVYQGIGDDAESTYKKISDWDLKLLQQQLSGLKEYSKEYHDVSLQIIEAERQKALEADTTGADTEKINKYYNKEIEKENKRHVKAILSEIGYIIGGITNVMKKITSTIISGIKNILSSFRNIGAKLFDFNIDDALDNLLVFEDKILTFFVETLPRLPAFIESAFQSVGVLLQNILGGEGLSNIFGNVFSTAGQFVEGIKTLIQSIDWENVFDIVLEAIMNGIEWVLNVLTNNTPKIIKMIINVVKKIAKKLPELVKVLIPVLARVFNEILKALPDLLNAVLPSILNSIIELVKAIGQNLPIILQNIAEMLPQLILGVVNAIADFIANLKAEDFVAIVTGVIKAVATLGVSLVKAIPQILKGLWELAKGLIKGMWNLILEALKATWKGLKWVLDLVVDWFKSTFGGYATGTNNAQKGLALVGEKGPELVDFKGGERVYNATNTQKILTGTTGGNTGNTFNVTFNNTTDTTAYTMMRQLKQYNRQMAINGII